MRLVVEVFWKMIMIAFEAGHDGKVWSRGIGGNQGGTSFEVESTASLEFSRSWEEGLG